MPCRHHIAELHIKHAYQKLVNHTNSPEEPLFNAFKDWFVIQRETDSSFPSIDAQRMYDYDWWAEDARVTIGTMRREEIGCAKTP